MTRTSHASALLFAVTLAPAASACRGALAPPPRPYEVVVVVEGDPGEPLAGVVFSREERPLATTGADGRAALTLDGVDGESVDATVQCPEGHTSPARPITVRLARDAAQAVPSVKVQCPKTQRRVVVAVKAENGPNLPVVCLGRVVARTDASGAAHFALAAPPGGQFQVTLDTTAKESAKLRPQSPSMPISVGHTDDVVVLEQKFEREPTTRKKKAAEAARLPSCLTCGKT